MYEFTGKVKTVGEPAVFGIVKTFVRIPLERRVHNRKEQKHDEG